jgi:hypothetical protein
MEGMNIFNPCCKINNKIEKIITPLAFLKNCDMNDIMIININIGRVVRIYADKTFGITSIADKEWYMTIVVIVDKKKVIIRPKKAKIPTDIIFEAYTLVLDIGITKDNLIVLSEISPENVSLVIIRINKGSITPDNNSRIDMEMPEVLKILTPKSDLKK